MKNSATPAILGSQTRRRVDHATDTGIGDSEITTFVSGHACAWLAHCRQQEGLVGQGRGNGVIVIAGAQAGGIGVDIFLRIRLHTRPGFSHFLALVL